MDGCPLYIKFKASLVAEGKREEGRREKENGSLVSFLTQENAESDKRGHNSWPVARKQVQMRLLTWGS